MCTARCPLAARRRCDPIEVYAIIAYILYSNDLVEDDFVLSNENFLEVEMPNADGFIVDDRETAEAAFLGRALHGKLQGRR